MFAPSRILTHITISVQGPTFAGINLCKKCDWLLPRVTNLSWYAVSFGNLPKQIRSKNVSGVAVNSIMLYNKAIMKLGLMKGILLSCHTCLWRVHCMCHVCRYCSTHPQHELQILASIHPSLEKDRYGFLGCPTELASTQRCLQIPWLLVSSWAAMREGLQLNYKRGRWSIVIENFHGLCSTRTSLLVPQNWHEES